jgi:hypothetical protein
MGFVETRKYRLTRSSAIGREKLEKVVEILKIPQLKADEVVQVTIDIERKTTPANRRNK